MFKRYAAFLCALALLTAGCSSSTKGTGANGTPALAAVEQVKGLDPGEFGLSSLPAGVKDLSFVYRLNGSEEATLPVEIPAGKAPVVVSPAYMKALPAAWFQYEWKATLADGTTQSLVKNERIINSQFTTDEWTVTRSPHVVLFTAKGAAAPVVEQVEKEYQREVQLYNGDRVKSMSTVRIYVFRNEKDFGHFTSAAGEALGVVDYGLQAAYVLSASDRNEVLRVTVHEMAHLVAGTSYGYPFLTEGLARYAEEPYIPASELDQYTKIVLARIKAMNGAPRGDSMSGWEMYGAGFWFVKYLDNHYGHDKFLDFLAQCREPRAFVDDVMEKVYGRKMRELDADMGKAVTAWAKGDRSLFQVSAGQ